MDEGRREAGRDERGHGVIEPTELGDRGGIVGLVGPGQVRPEPLPSQLGMGLERPDECDQPAGRRAHPVHAGVDLQMDPDGGGAGLACLPGQRLEVPR